LKSFCSEVLLPHSQLLFFAAVEFGTLFKGDSAHDSTMLVL